MGRWIWLAGLAAATLMGATLVVHADEDKAPMGGDDQAGMHDAMDGDTDGGMMGGHWGEKMKERLGLTDDQATQLKDFFKKQREANMPLRDQMRIDMDTLRQKVDMKASDGEVKKLLDKLNGDRKELQAAREKTVDRLREILTPTQQAKLLFAMKRGRGMMNRWKGKDGWKKDWKGPKGGSKGKGTGKGPDAAPPDVNN